MSCFDLIRSLIYRHLLVRNSFSNKDVVHYLPSQQQHKPSSKYALPERYHNYVPHTYAPDLTNTAITPESRMQDSVCNANRYCLASKVLL